MLPAQPFPACVARHAPIVRIIAAVLLLVPLIAGTTLSAHAATTITFIAEELLGKPTDTSITVNIVPGTTIVYHYQYGTAPSSYTGQTPDVTATAGQPSEVVISGLNADTKYFYRMQYHVTGETGWVDRSEHSFWTQRAKGSTFTFTVTSDSHAYMSNIQNAMTNILNEHPDLEFDLGDTFMLDSVTSQTDTNNAYLAYREPLYFDKFGGSTPIFLSSGNHENEEGWNLDDTPFSIAQGSIQARKLYYPTPIDGGFYSGNTDILPAIDAATYGDQYREDYYAWTWGDAMFVVIDPFQYTMNMPYDRGSGNGEGYDDDQTGDQWSWTLGKQQFNWLKTTLRDSNAKYKFVFSHQPVGGIPRDVSAPAGYVRGGAEAAGYFEWGGLNADGTPGFADHREAADFGSTPIHQLFVQNGVSVYFHGHDHQYVYETRDGVVYQEMPSLGWLGSGFTGIYTVGDHGTYNTIKILPNTGHLRVTVSPTQATVDYISGSSTSGTVNATYTVAPNGPTHTLTTGALPAGTGTVTAPAGTSPFTFDTGTVVRLVASPATGYHLASWTGDLGTVADVNAASTTVTMNGNYSIVANFAINTYTLKYAAGAHGSLTGNTSQTVTHGTDGTPVTAVADEGYEFVNWSDGSTANPRTDTNVTGSVDVTAHFDPIAPELNITGATADGVAMAGTIEGGFTLPTTNVAVTNHLVQFADGTTASKALEDTYFGLKLTHSTVSADDLKAYYEARGVPEPYLGYLEGAADGNAPFVYIKGTTVRLVDAAKHDLQDIDVDMTVPDDFPLGTYIVEGQIKDLAGNATDVQLILIVSGDRTPPETTITSTPDDPSASASASFEFTSSETPGTFECKLDDGDFASCSSPQAYSGLSDAAHTFQVRATDEAGNTDPTPAEYGWTVDTPLVLTALALRQSPDEAAWDLTAGDLASGYTVTLDPGQDFYYLDVATLTADHTLVDDYYGFTLDQAGLPAGWLDYWQAKGVEDGATDWQGQMWEIVNGRDPIFYLKVSGSTYMLVDGLGHLMGWPEDYLRVNGDYPLGAYSYSGSVSDTRGKSAAVTAHMAFIGPDVPEPPEVTPSVSGGTVKLTWPAVAQDAGGSYTIIQQYQVYCSTDPYFTPGPDTLVWEGSALEYSFAAPAAGGTFCTVQAANINGASDLSLPVGAFGFGMTKGSAQ